MAETEGVSQSLQHEPLNQEAMKRKSDVVEADEGEGERTVKQQKPDGPSGDFGDDVEKKRVSDQNGNVVKEKEKAVFSAADKGKGKMVVVETKDSDDEGDRKFRGSSDDDGSSVEGRDGALGGDDDDSDFSDDPLAELDLDNILSVRTRRRTPLEPGAYLVEDRGNGDDDDEDDDDEDDDVDDDDDDDDNDAADGDDDNEEEEQEEEEDERKQVGTAEK